MKTPSRLSQQRCLDPSRSVPLPNLSPLAYVFPSLSTFTPTPPWARSTPLDSEPQIHHSPCKCHTVAGTCKRNDGTEGDESKGVQQQGSLPRKYIEAFFMLPPKMLLTVSPQIQKACKLLLLPKICPIMPKGANLQHFPYCLIASADSTVCRLSSHTGCMHIPALHTLDAAAPYHSALALCAGKFATKSAPVWPMVPTCARVTESSD